jgi:hypothetical protein
MPSLKINDSAVTAQFGLRHIESTFQSSARFFKPLTIHAVQHARTFYCAQNQPAYSNPNKSPAHRHQHTLFSLLPTPTHCNYSALRMSIGPARPPNYVKHPRYRKLTTANPQSFSYHALADHFQENDQLLIHPSFPLPAPSNRNFFIFVPTFISVFMAHFLANRPIHSFLTISSYLFLSGIDFKNAGTRDRTIDLPASQPHAQPTAPRLPPTALWPVKFQTSIKTLNQKSYVKFFVLSPLHNLLYRLQKTPTKSIHPFPRSRRCRFPPQCPAYI